MSAASLPALRTCAFGDLDAGLWAVGYARVGDEQAVLLTGRPGEHQIAIVQTARLESSHEEGEWRIAGERVEVSLSPAGAGASIKIAEQGVEAACQPCRAEGAVVVDGAELEFACFGQRATHSGPENWSQIESLRAVAAWFGPDDGLSVISVRPRRAAGHDRDAVAAVLFEQSGPIVVTEPRLSTAYTGGGSPARASVELWLADSGDEPEDSEDGTEVPAQFPRRAAGEAVGATAELTRDRLDVRTELFRWHMRDFDGTGVYVLAHPG